MNMRVYTCVPPYLMGHMFQDIHAGVWQQDGQHAVGLQSLVGNEAPSLLSGRHSGEEAS